MLAAVGERAVLGAKGVVSEWQASGGACLSCEAGGSRGVVACSGGWSWGEAGGASRRSPVPEPAPNKALQPTPASLRSCLAAAARRG
jgi:hypothetical protein